jgi:hypothetical protein
METDFTNLEIIPADHSAKSLDVMMEEMKDSRKRLKNILQQFEGEYDFVFIDCPPGLSSFSGKHFQRCGYHSHAHYSNHTIGAYLPDGEGFLQGEGP